MNSMATKKKKLSGGGDYQATTFGFDKHPLPIESSETLDL